MNEERRKILGMLAEGKISADEADQLLGALGTSSDGSAGDRPKKRPRWLKVQVEPCGGGSGDRVNVKIPLRLLRTGLKLGAVLPGSVKGKVVSALGTEGIDFDLDKLDCKSVDELIDSLGEVCIEVKSDDECIRVCCE